MMDSKLANAVLSVFLATFLVVTRTQARLLQDPSLVADDVLQAFQSRQGVKPDYALPIQEIGLDNVVVLPDGATVSLDGVEPVSYYTPNAKCFQDHRQVSCSEPTVFAKTDENGVRVIVSKDANGDILNILVGQKNSGQSTKLVAVAPGIVTYIPPEAFDVNFYNKFVLADPLVNTIGEQIRQGLRPENLENIEHEENESGTSPNDFHRRLGDTCNDEYRVIEVGVASESSFCKFVNGENNVEPMINSIMAGVAFEYELDGLCFTARISFKESFCDESNDPLRNAVQENDASILLITFGTYWNKNNGGVERDLAVLLSGTPLQEVECPDGSGETCRVIGMANGIGASCINANRHAYAVNYVTFSENVGNMVRSFCLHCSVDTNNVSPMNIALISSPCFSL
jgi:hypothetical protein